MNRPGGISPVAALAINQLCNWNPRAKLIDDRADARSEVPGKEPARYVRHDRYLGMPPERASAWQRFHRINVDRRRGDVPGIERRDQLGFDYVLATAEFDDRSALRQSFERFGANDAARPRRQRQQVYQDFAAGQD
jgi:hypothetical protein